MIKRRVIVTSWKPHPPTASISNKVDDDPETETAVTSHLTRKKIPKFTEMNDLASEKAGGRILFATDDWFATAENLLKVEPPVWIEGKFTNYGKWMDGWETRRKRKPGHDWCIIRLGEPGRIFGIEVDTSHFTGNHAPACSLQAACLTPDQEALIPYRHSKMGSEASERNLQQVSKIKSEDWKCLLPMSRCGPGYPETCHNYFHISSTNRWTHVRFNIYPDGGVARLHLHGQVIPDWTKVPVDKMVDLVAMQNGGMCLGFSNAHYGHARNLISKGQSKVMADGWETARRPDRPAVLEADHMGILKVPGCEWAVFRLGHPGTIIKVEIDTKHFKGNFPDSCKIEVCNIRKGEEDALTQQQSAVQWCVLLPTTKLSAHKQHFYTRSDLKDAGVVTHARLTIAPDGGVSRMRLWGFRAAPAKL